MAITKMNNYIPGQDLTNLANNVDYNRLGDDKTQITVNFAVSPAEVTIKQGSLWECNGNIYTVDADYTFAMANAAHNYITFTDNPASAFSSVATKQTFDATKQGLYDAGTNTIRTLRWYIDQTEETYNIDDSIMAYNIGDLKTEINSYVINEADRGITIDNTDLTLAVAGAPTAFSGNSNDFHIYKPCTLVFRVVEGVTPGVAWNTDVSAKIQQYHNGGWIDNESFTVTNAAPTDYDRGICLNPGRYRLYISGIYINGSGGPAVVASMYIYLVSVYGQTNIDAGSVYA